MVYIFQIDTFSRRNCDVLNKYHIDIGIQNLQFQGLVKLRKVHPAFIFRITEGLYQICKNMHLHIEN